MKSITLLNIFLSLTVCAFTQNKSKDKFSAPFKKEKDTSYAYVDYNGNIINLPGMQYIRKSWPEQGLWKEHLYDAGENYLARTGSFHDAEFKDKHGLFEEFHPKGFLKTKVSYLNNKREGAYLSFYENGKPNEIYNYLHDLPIDSAMEFFEEGSIKFRGYFDKTGNGSGTEFYRDGKQKLSGNIMAGKRNGTWVVNNEEGTKIMEVTFVADSVANTTCFGADGKTPEKGDCVFEKPAEFPGGSDGWRKFLQKNLRYPDIAVKKGIQGIVRVQFIVDKDGGAKELNVLTSPDASLSYEVLRLMKQSPDWLPAIQYNKAVIYRHIQAITFRLE